jgi:hypothetical protein
MCLCPVSGFATSLAKRSSMGPRRLRIEKCQFHVESLHSCEAMDRQLAEALRLSNNGSV